MPEVQADLAYRVLAGLGQQGSLFLAFGVYFRLAQFNMSFQTIVARTSVEPRALLEFARRTVREVDATVPIVDLRTLDGRRRVVLLRDTER